VGRFVAAILRRDFLGDFLGVVFGTFFSTFFSTFFGAFFGTLRGALRGALRAARALDGPDAAGAAALLTGSPIAALACADACA
jgi:hypothetical protein